MKKERNASIEGLRGFSALLVIVYHCYNMAVEAGLSHPFANPLAVKAMAVLGEFAVDLFFIISGYLIIGSLVKHGNVRLFLQNRAFRIYPVFLILHMILFTAGPLIGYEWMGKLRHDPVQYGLHFASNLFFLPGIFNLPIAQKNAWSLSYELAFYLLASICYLVATRFHQRTIAVKAPLYLLALGLCGIVLWFHPRAWFFVIGVFAFYVADRMEGKVWDSLTWLGADLTALIVSFVFCVQKYPALSLALALLAFLFLVSQRGLLALIFRTRAMQLLGMISYSLYLLHPFVLYPLRSLFTHIAAHTAQHSSGGIALTTLFFLIGSAGSVALATASYYGVEKRLTGWLKSRLTTPRRRVVPSEA